MLPALEAATCAQRLNPSGHCVCQGASPACASRPPPRSRAVPVLAAAVGCALGQVSRHTSRTRHLRRVLQPFAIEPINPFMAEMKANVKGLAENGLGILDAEGAGRELMSCLEAAGMEPNEESRQRWREFCYTNGLQPYCSAVIMEEEALKYTDKDSRSLPQILSDQGVVPAMRVDQGFVPLNSFGEKGTEGIVLLKERCEDYYKSGVRIAKWRTQLECNLEMPTDVAVWENSDCIARAARICQANGLAFIAEIQTSQNTGSHSIERTAYVCEKFYSNVVRSMNEYDVNLEAVAFTIDTCAAGPDAMVPLSDQVARYTVRTLMRTLPPATGAVLLLAGEVAPEEAVRNAKAVQDEAADMTWEVAPVYGTGLLNPVISAWASGEEDTARELLQRLLDACKSAQLADAESPR